MDVNNWEQEYLNMNPDISKRQKELLQGDSIKSHEGMLYGSMNADWKRRKEEE